MVKSASLGFPRIGKKRELKKAMESFWAGKINEAEFIEQTNIIKEQNWILQKEKGIDFIPSNDFSYYDHVLDTAVMVGAIPKRYNWSGGKVDLKTYFAMARGDKNGLTAMEMTKWFDTNYHYIVPEFEAGQKFKFTDDKIIRDFNQAKKLGVHTRPVLLGPISFLKLGKSKNWNATFYEKAQELLPVYEEVLKKLAEAGADWVQIDEPCLILELSEEESTTFKHVYERLSKSSDELKILLATYFGALKYNTDLATHLPVCALHIDCVRGAAQFGRVVSSLRHNKMSLSLGFVNSRNVWKSDLSFAYNFAKEAVKDLGADRVFIAPSSSLMFSPMDLDDENKIDSDIKNWMSFATQKLDEITTLTKALNTPADAEAILKPNREALESRRISLKVHNPKVKDRMAALKPSDADRINGYSVRKKKQKTSLGLPLFPTTTIGSFAQTNEVRTARAEYKANRMLPADYEAFLRREVRDAVAFQEEIDLDVLVHGEFERNDMVEYFGEQLEGFIHSKNGWVQSYGSRCVKPPIIFGDVSRPEPMTVHWWKYAQGCTNKPMKGMLTGPVTILQWSFVRDDQDRSITCKQIALALRDEVLDLEKAGAKIIQIDEAALREGLPLSPNEWAEYLDWAVESFRIAASGVKDETQIHTHMCYSEFNDIIKAIGAMDADVISIETSRSQMELLQAFSDYKYPNEIGPGVYDIHSPRVPTEDEIINLLQSALKVISPEQLWINPDCGLKTRRWEEIKPSLQKMTSAARRLRNDYANL